MQKNILLPTIGSAGDVHPMMALGDTLRERGHQVTIVTNPLHEETVREAGFAFHPLGTRAEAQALIDNPDLWHPRRGFATIARGAILPALRPLYNFIAAQDPSNTIIAAQSLALGARLAHEKLGIPLATLHLQPSLIRSVIDPPINGAPIPAWWPFSLRHLWWRLADAVVIDRELGFDLNVYRSELGLPPIRRIFHDWLHAPQRVLGLFPDWFAPPQPDWPPQTRLTGFPLYDGGALDGGAADGEGSPLPDELMHFLDAGEAPLVFTFGSAMQHGAELYAASIAATQQLGCRAVLLTRDRSQLPATLPETIHYQPYVPLGDLLPHAALLGHHGGIGTLSQGFAAGLPQLVLPLSHDQPDNAQRLERLGAGRALSPARLRPRAMAQAIAQLISSETVKVRCRELALRIDAQEARAAAAGYIEALAAS